MRETIVVQVGQCGNQIGNMFWSYLLHEHVDTPDTDDALSAFFRFAPERSGVSAMKARALLVDMECGPLQETMRSPLGALFEETQFVMDVYGSGNNWAHGFAEYGPKYRANFEEGLRRNAEHCDSLQTFLILHSLGGGTGSGVGTYLLGLIHELFPDVYRFSSCVFPSEDDDVVTSPYNSILATSELVEHADCIFPLDNHALQNFAELESRQQKKKEGDEDSPVKNAGNVSKYKQRGFDNMNSVAARMLCHLTASSRFQGDMNVDMNEICTNLVPFPQLNFLMTALSPQRAISGVGFGSSSVLSPSITTSARDKARNVGGGGSVATGALHAQKKKLSVSARHQRSFRPPPNALPVDPVFSSRTASSRVPTSAFISRSAVQRAFTDILSVSGQLTAAVPTACLPMTSAYGTSVNSSSTAFSSPAGGLRSGNAHQPTCLASCFITRGSSVALSDFLYCVTAAQSQQLRFPIWNANACKIGMCGTPFPGETMSVLGVYNSSAFGHVLGREIGRFSTLFRRKAMLHHYTEFIEPKIVEEAEVTVNSVVRGYQEIENGGAHLSFDGKGKSVPRVDATIQLFPSF